MRQACPMALLGFATMINWHTYCHYLHRARPSQTTSGTEEGGALASQPLKVPHSQFTKEEVVRCSQVEPWVLDVPPA